jgi:hypothetical protein
MSTHVTLTPDDIEALLLSAKTLQARCGELRRSAGADPFAQRHASDVGVIATRLRNIARRGCEHQLEVGDDGRYHCVLCEAIAPCPVPV